MLTESKKINIQKTDHSRINEVDFDNIQFGKLFSDHMFVAEYKNGKWDDFSIMPFQNISVSPACAALHYGQALFEGMKAYKNENNEIFIFRPLENAKRLNQSAERLCMPSFPESLYMEALTQLIKIDSNWVSNKENNSLYIRPFMFGSEQLLGVRPAEEYKFIIFTAPVSSYYSEPVNVKIETYYTRAAEGGVGFAKAAGNYAAALYPANEAKKQGYHQLVWTDAKEHRYIEESGTMNIMFVVDGVLITPNLDFKTTLAGVTRDSVLTLAREEGIKVEERRVTVDEIIDAYNKGVLNEVFGTGTAATIAQVASITHKDVRMELPPIEGRTISNSIAKKLQDIKKGRVADTHGWVYKI